MKPELILRIALLSSLAPVAGCTADQIQRMGFDLAQQHECMRQNEHKPNESMEDLKCMGANRERDQAYEQYQKDREALTGADPGASSDGT